MENDVINIEYDMDGLRKMRNWKEPGPDGVRNFWFMHFQYIHTPNEAALQKVVKSSAVPEWLLNNIGLQSVYANSCQRSHAYH